MKLKIDGITFRVVTNELNRKFFRQGMFENISEVLVGGKWYRCGIRFEGEMLIVSDLMVVDKNTSVISEHIKGEYLRTSISSYRKNLIQFALNKHIVNYKIHHVKEHVRCQMPKILLFLVLFALSIGYFLVNVKSDNFLNTWLANNPVSQVIAVFLTLVGVVSLVKPVTVQKEISSKDIEEIASKKIAQQKKDDERRKKIERLSNL